MSKSLDKSFALSKKLPTKIPLVMPLVTRIASKIKTLTGSQDEAFAIKLVLEESLTNCMRHGNKLDEKKFVTLKIAATKKIITIDLHDEGKGFDYTRVPDPTKGKRLNQPSGRGIYLMRSIMQKVVFYDKGSGVKMNKTFAIH